MSIYVVVVCFLLTLTGIYLQGYRKYLQVFSYCAGQKDLFKAATKTLDKDTETFQNEQKRIE